MIGWIIRDWQLKLVSLILALGLWTYAVSEESVDVKRTVPLEIKIKNPQMSILSRSTDSLQVTLSARRGLVSDLTSERIRVVHEIGEEVKAAGDYSFRVEPGEVRLPHLAIRVLRIEPEIVQVKLDEVIVQKLQVKPNFSGDPAFGYKVVTDEIQLDPNAVLVEGPKGQLEKLDAVPTEPIDLVGRIRAFRRTLAIQLPQNVKAVSEALIDAYIPIREEFEEKNFKEIPYKILRSAEGNGTVTVEPKQVSFTLKGSKRQLEKLTPENILTYLDLSARSEGEHEVSVTVILPEEVSLKDSPPVVKVSIQKK